MKPLIEFTTPEMYRTAIEAGSAPLRTVVLRELSNEEYETLLSCLLHFGYFSRRKRLVSRDLNQLDFLSETTDAASEYIMFNMNTILAFFFLCRSGGILRADGGISSKTIAQALHDTGDRDIHDTTNTTGLDENRYSDAPQNIVADINQYLTNYNRENSSNNSDHTSSNEHVRDITLNRTETTDKKYSNTAAQNAILKSLDRWLWLDEFMTTTEPLFEDMGTPRTIRGGNWFNW